MTTPSDARGTGWPQKKSNLKKTKQSEKEGVRGLSLGASQWHRCGVQDTKKSERQDLQGRKKRAMRRKCEVQGEKPT